jgi:hypothetical protein
VNVDGVDSRAAYRIMRHGRGDDAAALDGAVAAALEARGHRCRRAALPFGVWVDGAILASAGWSGVTVSRGDWRTLAVVHTRGDVAARVEIGTVVEAGRALAQAVERVLD